MPNELKPCPECGAEMTIGYACGEYFVYAAGRSCFFCEGFNEMHSNENYEKEVWNKHVDKHKGIIIGVDLAKDKDGEVL